MVAQIFYIWKKLFTAFGFLPISLQSTSELFDIWSVSVLLISQAYDGGRHMRGHNSKNCLLYTSRCV